MKVLITGGRGMLGNALLSVLNPQKYKIVTSTNADLTREEDVEETFQSLKPDIVVHCAARVGGVLDNATNQAEFYRANMLMNTHMIDYACKYGAEKFISFSSVCAFADGLPILQENLHQFGEPHETNFAYAYTKRMMQVQMRAYSQAYKTKFHCIIPSNLYGEHDNFHLKKSHVIPALIHKMYVARNKKTQFEVWGNGTACREFLYARDLARVVERFIDEDVEPQTMIVSNSQQISMKQVVELLTKIYEFDGEVVWNTDKLTGQQKRPSDNTLFTKTFPDMKFTDLEDGLRNTVEWFLLNYEKARK